jgi:hypothetical protein|tara:strand:+ start:42 stop:263 length:222 start_codon:yes stop_codon:yes gene_type:complete
MRTFKQLREAMKKGMPPGKHVYDKKIKGVELMVHEIKGSRPFVTYIDKEELDRFKDLNTAKKAGEAFIKAAKG